MNIANCKMKIANWIQAIAGIARLIAMFVFLAMRHLTAIERPRPTICNLHFSICNLQSFCHEDFCTR